MVRISSVYATFGMWHAGLAVGALHLYALIFRDCHAIDGFWWFVILADDVNLGAVDTNSADIPLFPEKIALPAVEHQDFVFV